MTHHHLTRDERVALSALTRAGQSGAECARQLGVHRSTVLRELQRTQGEYRAAAAHKVAKKLREASKRDAQILEHDASLRRKVVQLLKRNRSPEQIAQELGSISDDAIYAWINRSRRDLRILLPQRGKKRHRYGKEPHQGWTKSVRNIATRPKVAARRSRVGDWEGDTIVGRDRARLLVHVDRRSRFIVALLIPDGTADTVHNATITALKKLPCHTITYDRGSEFALWRMIEQDLKARVYFANAHHPWERGTSENSNGLLRRFFPKGTPLGQTLVREVAKAVRNINHRPRKCLRWKTPCQVFRCCCDSS